MVPGLWPPDGPPGGAALGVDHWYPFIPGPLSSQHLAASTTDKKTSLKHPTTSATRLPGAMATTLAHPHPPVSLGSLKKGSRTV